MGVDLVGSKGRQQQQQPPRRGDSDEVDFDRMDDRQVRRCSCSLILPAL